MAKVHESRNELRVRFGDCAEMFLGSCVVLGEVRLAGLLKLCLGFGAQLQPWSVRDDVGGAQDLLEEDLILRLEGRLSLDYS